MWMVNFYFPFTCKAAQAVNDADQFFSVVQIQITCPLGSSMSSGIFLQSNKQHPPRIWCAHTFSPSLIRKTNTQKHIFLWALSVTFFTKWFLHAGVGATTLMHGSMFSIPALLTDSGSNRSTFRQHVTILQAEHTLDWYFQSADFNWVYNFNWY